jgi:protein SCO1/2
MTTAALPTNASETPKTRSLNWFSRGVGNPWFWVAFIVLSMTVHITRAVMTSLPKPLPVLGHVPDFQLTNQHNEFFGAQQLKGKVWIANFIFTRCPTLCPITTQKMAGVMHRTRNLGEGFHLVSISVDPEHDQPAELLAFAQKYRTSPRMWTFLTGARDSIKSLLVDGMKVHMTQDGPTDDLMSIGHSGHFVLVDAKMQIRGYYDSNEVGVMDRLVRDAGLVVNRGE